MINFLRVVTGSRNVYNDGGSGTNSFFNIGGIRIEGSSTSILIILALALIISIIVFSCVVKTRKIPKTRFFNWLKEFLNFRSILIENILKFIYLFLATLLTLISIYAIKENVLAFLVLFIVGNLALRIVFEFSLMLIVIWKNTSDISASANSIRSVVAPNKLEQRIEQKQEIKKQKREEADEIKFVSSKKMEELNNKPAEEKNEDVVEEKNIEEPSKDNDDIINNIE